VWGSQWNDFMRRELSIMPIHVLVPMSFVEQTDDIA
jgi:hypothetical protein